MVEKDFRVNEYLSLKLEEGKTYIYINEERFDQCKYLAFYINDDEIQHHNNIQSIDELEQNDHSEEFYHLKISPEEEFWGHCSNIQAWVENNYDTRLLHRTLSFPLLEELTEVGAPRAEKMLKEEIQRRLQEKSPVVTEYLIVEGYLRYFDQEELKSIKCLSSLQELDMNSFELYDFPNWIESFVSLKKLI